MTGNAIELVPNALEIAKRMLTADKRLMTVAWIVRGGRVIEFYPLDFPTQEAKRLTMHRLADRVAAANADGVVFIGESWVAEIDPGEDITDPRIQRASERPNRREVIQVNGFTRDGQKAERTLFFEHDANGEVVFGELLVDIGGVPNFLEPIRRRWAMMDTVSDNPGEAQP